MKIIKKTAYLLLVLLCVSFLSFFLANISPIDPAEAYARRISRSAGTELIAQYKKITGFDKTLPEQYWSWVKRAARLDFGVSYITKKDIRTELYKALPATLTVAVCAAVFIIVFSVPLGITAALNKGDFADRLIGFFSFVSFSVPGYFAGLLCLRYFGMYLHWFPVIGHGHIVSVLFAAFVLALPMIGMLTRLLRSFLLENEDKEYIQYAKARGIGSRHIMTRHLLRNAAPVLLTLWGQNIGYLIAGTAIAESIFSIPGIGIYALNAAINRDFPVINAYLMLTAFAFVVCNGAAEFLGAALNPLLRNRA